jgi:DNA-directed RNA polymerase subunit RPC12/RpoP
MWSYPSSTRIYRCPQCLARITVREFDEHLVVCPGCGNTLIVSPKYVSLAASLGLLASYACSFLLVNWLTHDIRRFMLPVLECAFMLIVLSALFLFPLLPRNVKPRGTLRRLNDNCRRDVA